MTLLEAEDDAAHVKLGGNWRIPTYIECSELIEKCSWELISQNGVKGIKFTSTINGNCIFLPNAGWRQDDTVNDDYGIYCTSSLFSKDLAAYLVSHLADNYPPYTGNVLTRCCGAPVRPVTE